VITTVTELMLVVHGGREKGKVGAEEERNE
jgi:hypothetical protein